MRPSAKVNFSYSTAAAQLSKQQEQLDLQLTHRNQRIKHTFRGQHRIIQNHDHLIIVLFVFHVLVTVTTLYIVRIVHCVSRRATGVLDLRIINGPSVVCDIHAIEHLLGLCMDVTRLYCFFFFSYPNYDCCKTFAYIEFRCI